MGCRSWRCPRKVTAWVQEGPGRDGRKAEFEGGNTGCRRGGRPGTGIGTGELELCSGTLGDRQPRTRQLPQSRPGNKQQRWAMRRGGEGGMEPLFGSRMTVSCPIGSDKLFVSSYLPFVVFPGSFRQAAEREGVKRDPKQWGASAFVLCYFICKTARIRGD
jgi:hypothetical protein